MKLKTLKNHLINTVFPQFCFNCGKQGAVICSDCLSLIEISEYVFCPFCNTPKRVIKRGACNTHKNYALNGIFSATMYNQAITRRLIHCFKYPPYLKTISPYLAYLIITHLGLSRNYNFLTNKNNSVFIPIPLLKNKKRQRGFNQSELIAKELSNTTKIPLLINQLVKIKKTKPQSHLTKEQRKQNIKNAFAVKNSEKIKGRIIFLVDDIFTTGSTMEQAAIVLKKAGALEVWGITVAREP